MNNIVVERYSVELCKKNPEIIFVFGDNLLEIGKAGQAIIRDCENSFGIPTKRKPCTKENCYFSDKEDELFAYDKSEWVHVYAEDERRDLGYESAE